MSLAQLLVLVMVLLVTVLLVMVSLVMVPLVMVISWGFHVRLFCTKSKLLYKGGIENNGCK